MGSAFTPIAPIRGNETTTIETVRKKPLRHVTE